MSAGIAATLAVVMIPTLWGQDAGLAVRRSKELLARWAPVATTLRNATSSSGGAATSLHDTSWSLDREFEKLNGGCDASLAMLETILQGDDVAARRNAAAVIGEIRFGIGSEPVDWPRFRSKELQLAAKYVTDKDAVTAANATDAFVYFLEGGSWDGWGNFPAKWTESLEGAQGPQARDLCKLFAFTPVPISKAIPGLYRLFQSSDPEESSSALCALARAQLVAPPELREIALADVDSKSTANRAAAFRNLEALAAFLWDNVAPSQWVQKKIDRQPYYLLTAWFRSTMTRIVEQTDQTRLGGRQQLLGILERGLADRDPSVRLACAKALIPIGKVVDKELGSGSRMRFYTNKEDVARLLLRAAKLVAKDVPRLATQANNLAIGFDRPRTVW